MTENKTRFKVALIFTGHMVDLPKRPVPRFPPDLEREAAKAIHRRVAYAAKAAGGSVIGIASGARGGDILFLEACQKVGLETRIVLPFEPDQFLETSVSGAPTGEWVARFETLWNGARNRDREVLKAPDAGDPYDYCNRQMLALAQRLAEHFRLIALWDGKDTELKPGGTATFVALVRRAKGSFSHINTETLLQKLPRRTAMTNRNRQLKSKDGIERI